MGGLKYFTINGKEKEYETYLVNVSKNRALSVKSFLKKKFGNQVLVRIVKARKGSGGWFTPSISDGYDLYTNPDERDFHKLKRVNK